MKIVLIEPGNRVQLPAEWVAQLHLQGAVTLQQTPEGILIRPCQPLSWDEVFANKLVIGRSTSHEQESLELSGDDLLF